MIIADGYYEWMQSGGKKYPYYIHHPERKILYFAGLWDEWMDNNRNKWKTCAIITTKANEEIQYIHNRMPAIINKFDIDLWMNSHSETQEAIKLLEPFDRLDYYPVSRFVNDPGNNSQLCTKYKGSGSL